MGMLTKLVNNGDVMVKALLVHAITDLNKFLNFQNIMTTQQITETAIMILSDFNYLKIEDVRVCFNNGKKGHYGQLYARIDGQIIMLWLQQYSTDKTNEYLRIKDFNEKQALNKKIDPSEVNKEGQLKVAQAMREALKAVEVAKVEKPIREKSTSEKLIKRFINQFQKIAIKRGLDSDTKYIFMYKKIITCEEYLKIKLSQQDRVIKLLINKK